MLRDEFLGHGEGLLRLDLNIWFFQRYDGLFLVSFKAAQDDLWDLGSSAEVNASLQAGLGDGIGADILPKWLFAVVPVFCYLGGDHS